MRLALYIGIFVGLCLLVYWLVTMVVPKGGGKETDETLAFADAEKDYSETANGEVASKIELVFYKSKYVMLKEKQKLPINIKNKTSLDIILLTSTVRFINSGLVLFGTETLNITAAPGDNNFLMKTKPVLEYPKDLNTFLASYPMVKVELTAINDGFPIKITKTLKDILV